MSHMLFVVHFGHLNAYGMVKLEESVSRESWMVAYENCGIDEFLVTTDL